MTPNTQSEEDREMADLSALVERLEKAEGPSLEIDRLIFEARRSDWGVFFGSPVVAMNYNGHYVDFETADGFKHKQAVRIPNFSATIDAATIPLPDGVEWEISTLHGVARAGVGLNTEHPCYASRADCNAPLAMCEAVIKWLAALRALNNKESGNG